MLALWQSYFDLLAHPFYSHALMRKERLEAPVEVEEGQLLGDGENVTSLFESETPTSESPGLDFPTIMSLSWPFYIMRACYIIVGIYFTGQVISSEFRGDMLAEYFSISYDFKIEQYMLYTTLLWVVFFPLGAWVTMKFWSLLLGFFAKLFMVEEEHLGEVCDEVARSTLVSNFFLILPIIGDLLKQVSSWVYLYAGCRANLGLSRMQSMIIIVSPLILTSTLMVFMFAYFALLLSVLI